jgi:hypothetical protein
MVSDELVRIWEEAAKPNWHTIPAFLWRSRKTSVRVARISWLRFELAPLKYLECYCFTRCLSKPFCFWLYHMPYFHFILIVMHFFVEMAHSRDSRFVFLVSKKFSDLLWDPPSLLFSLYWRFYPRSMNLTTDIHLVLMFSISGAKPLLHLHTFIAWTGTTLLCFDILYALFVCMLYRTQTNDKQYVTQWLLNMEPWCCAILCRHSSLEGCQQ